ncbi:MAG: limonene-1,2-epoxide hydrolase family protein [bacterium]
MTQHTPSPLEVVRSFNEAMAKVDFPAAMAYVAADCQYTNGPMETVVGPAGVKAILEPFFAPIRENEFIIKREAANNETVFVERLDRHRFDSGWVELPVTGVYEVRGGQIATWRDYFDLGTIQSQLAPGA